MPQQMWKHTCPKSGSPHWTGSPACRTCGGVGEYDGWHLRMHEAMARYQTRYRLKPIGPHRRMTDELFASVTVRCQACAGRGLRDTADGSSWVPCFSCEGFGSLFTRPAEEIEALRRRVLAIHPDAAADPVPDFLRGPLALSGATQQIIDLARSATPHANSAGFDGFPYLVIRVAPNLYHITLLPGDASEPELAAIARAQRRANHLGVWLILGPQHALSIELDGRDRLEVRSPCAGVPVTGRLRPPRTWPETADLRARQRRLANFIETHGPKSGYLFGDRTKGGREATADDVARLSGVGLDGLPRGLARCPTCREWRGQCLDPSPSFFCRVVTVHCRCQNDSRCAACGELLADRKLNANYYDPRDRQIWHIPGFCGLGHLCAPATAAKATH